MTGQKFDDGDYLQIVQAWEACGRSASEAARRLNLSRNQVAWRLEQARTRGLVMDKADALALPAAEEAPPRLDTSALRRALRAGRHSIDELAKSLDVSRGTVVDGIDAMRAASFAVHEQDGKHWLDTTPQAATDRQDATHEYTSRADGSYVFGFTSDNHLGSKYSRLDVLAKLFQRFQEVGVDRVFNAGNWIDGEASFNKHDLVVHGMDAQCRYLAKHWPKVPGLTTYAVTGDDHEGWYSQRDGVDMGRYAQQKFTDAGRSDWVDLGYMEADIKLVHAGSGATNRLRVAHPGGGSAYAISYAPQKYIESLDGGEKPGIVLLGHWHKMSFDNIRNVWVIQTGCFLGGTWIETDQGRKRIKDIRVGDMVLTHRGHYKPVTKLFKRMHSEEMVSLSYGRKGRSDQTLTATREHPVLVERVGGAREWVPIADVQAGDVIFVKSARCSVSGELIPYWMQMSKHHNPMDRPATRDKLSATKGGRTLTRGGSDGEAHTLNDVVPFCDRMVAQGWRMAPVGGGVIPDAIGYKDGKMVAFEVERSTGRVREFKLKKYEAAPISRFIDDVKWTYLNERVEQPRSWYEPDPETGFCRVVVIGKTIGPVKGAHNRQSVSVYNFSVQDDESYVAGNVVVHNCTQDQTPFGRKKKLDFQVGGGLCKLQQDPETGALTSCTVELLRFFNLAHYGSGRWSHHTDVTMADRVVG